MNFYATRNDLIPVLSEIEKSLHFRYFLCGLFKDRPFSEYGSALLIPSLGRAKNDSAINCEAFLVIPREATVAVREVHQDNGGIRYAVDQLLNPLSITFQAGGVFDETALLSGRVATCSTLKEAKSMLGLFERRLKKHFTKCQAYYVGPEAMELKEKGLRLTIAIKSPGEFDLR